MSNINLHYQISDSAQKVALLAGIPAGKMQTVEIAATDALLNMAEVTPEGKANIYALPSCDATVGFYACAEFDAVLTPETAVDAFHAAMEQTRLRLQRKHAENLTYLREHWNRLVGHAANERRSVEFVEAPSYMWLPHTEDAARLTSEDVAALGWKEAVKSTINVLREQEKIEQKLFEFRRRKSIERLNLQEPRIETDEHKRMTQLGIWVQTHGSEALRFQFDNRLWDWKQAAERAFLAMYLPEGFRPDVYPRQFVRRHKEPTERERKALEEMLSLVDQHRGVLSGPCLRRVMVLNASKRYNPLLHPHPGRYVALYVKVKTPLDSYTMVRLLTANCA